MTAFFTEMFTIFTLDDSAIMEMEKRLGKAIFNYKSLIFENKMTRLLCGNIFFLSEVAVDKTAELSL